MPAKKKSMKRKPSKRKPKKGVNRWIQKALGIKKGVPRKKGALHRALGVPVGKKIPMKILNKATKKPGKVGRQARLAKTLRGFKKKSK